MWLVALCLQVLLDRPLCRARLSNKASGLISLRTTSWLKSVYWEPDFSTRKTMKIHHCIGRKRENTQLEIEKAQRKGREVFCSTTAHLCSCTRFNAHWLSINYIISRLVWYDVCMATCLWQSFEYLFCKTLTRKLISITSNTWIWNSGVSCVASWDKGNMTSTAHVAQQHISTPILECRTQPW